MVLYQGMLILILSLLHYHEDMLRKIDFYFDSYFD
jgi:hypothetical protein